MEYRRVAFRKSTGVDPLLAATTRRDRPDSGHATCQILGPPDTWPGTMHHQLRTQVVNERSCVSDLML
jgi:hypothetical protein